MRDRSRWVGEGGEGGREGERRSEGGREGGEGGRVKVCGEGKQFGERME